MHQKFEICTVLCTYVLQCLIMNDANLYLPISSVSCKMRKLRRKPKKHERENEDLRARSLEDDGKYTTDPIVMHGRN